MFAYGYYAGLLRYSLTRAKVTRNRNYVESSYDDHWLERQYVAADPHSHTR